MPVPQHLRLTFSGEVRGTNQVPIEEWSWSIKSAMMGDGGDVDMTDLTAAATAAKTAYSTEIALLHDPFIVLTRVRCSAHLEGGLTAVQADGSYAHHDVAGPVPGVATSRVRYPLQTSLAVSLESDRAGATGRGRFFLPQTSVVLDVDYTLVQADVDETLLRVENLFDKIRPTFGDVRVVSSKGYSSVVQRIKVGQVLDTQRSRRSHLPEKYTERTLTR